MILFTPASVLLSPLALLSMDEYHIGIEEILTTLHEPDTRSIDDLGYLMVEKAFPARTICLSYVVASSLEGGNTSAVVDEILCTAPLPF